ncbi:TPA: hypothetical protein VAO37_001683 [Streptococcus agalactiae]|nr:hypothetical protein [Streptococcus agalactiae]
MAKKNNKKHLKGKLTALKEGYVKKVHKQNQRLDAEKKANNNKTPKGLAKVARMETTKNKVIILGTVALLSFSVGAIAIHHADGGNSQVTVATFDGGSIKSEDLYNQLKNNTTGSGLVRDSLILSVFEKNYGSHITDKMVNENYTSYLYSGLSTVGNKGTNETDFKKLVKQELAYEYGMKQNLSASTKEMKAIYDAGWQPDVKVKYLIFARQEDAKKAYSSVEKGKTFSSVSNKALGGATDTQTLIYGNNFIGKDIYSMKDNEKKLITFKNKGSNGKEITYYAVVEMVKNNPNSGNWKDYQKELATIVKLNKMSNKTNNDVKTIIKKEFKKAHVVINDDYLKKALKDYVG